MKEEGEKRKKESMKMRKMRRGSKEKEIGSHDIP